MSVSSLAESAALIAAGALSPVELTNAVLERIAAEDGELRAYVMVCAEQACGEARQLEHELVRGERRGPLHGIPVAVKDLIDTAGVPTTSGSRVRLGNVPDADAPVVRRVKTAGGIVIGKTNTHEFAYGPICAPTRNAQDRGRISGGSSGGSAVAVATGMCVAALGSDTGGSIRIPASFNGVVGLKPTYGRVPKSGVTPLSWSLDHVGPITRTVTDAALMLGVLAGRDESDPTSAHEPVEDYVAGLERDLAGVRLGLPAVYFREEIEPAVLEVFDRAVCAFEAAGAALVEVTVPHLDLTVPAELGILLPEASAYHQGDLRRVADLYGLDVRTLLELGEFYLGTHYVNAQRGRTLVKESMRRCFEQAGLDALLVPTVPMPPPRVGQETVRYPGIGERTVIGSLFRHCAPFNLTGQPVLTVPCGIDADGLSVGLAIAGRPFAEATVLRVGRAFEKAAPPSPTAGEHAPAPTPGRNG